MLGGILDIYHLLDGVTSNIYCNCKYCTFTLTSTVCYLQQVHRDFLLILWILISPPHLIRYYEIIILHWLQNTGESSMHNSIFLYLELPGTDLIQGTSNPEPFLSQVSVLFCVLACGVHTVTCISWCSYWLSWYFVMILFCVSIKS